MEKRFSQYSLGHIRLAHQRDELETERREIADQRLHESILGPIIANMGPLLVCALVLVFCGLLVYGLRVDKRSLECYLHPDAVFEASGIEVEFSDQDPVAELVARRRRNSDRQIPWDDLPQRSRRRHCARVKQWLNTRAVEQMTPAQLLGQQPAESVSIRASVVREALRKTGKAHSGGLEHIACQNSN